MKIPKKVVNEYGDSFNISVEITDYGSYVGTYIDIYVHHEEGVNRSKLQLIKIPPRKLLKFLIEEEIKNIVEEMGFELVKFIYE